MEMPTGTVTAVFIAPWEDVAYALTSALNRLGYRIDMVEQGPISDGRGGLLGGDVQVGNGLQMKDRKYSIHFIAGMGFLSPACLMYAMVFHGEQSGASLVHISTTAVAAYNWEAYLIYPKYEKIGRKILGGVGKYLQSGRG